MTELDFTILGGEEEEEKPFTILEPQTPAPFEILETPNLNEDFDIIDPADAFVPDLLVGPEDQDEGFLADQIRTGQQVGQYAMNLGKEAGNQIGLLSNAATQALIQSAGVDDEGVKFALPPDRLVGPVGAAISVMAIFKDKGAEEERQELLVDLQGERKERQKYRRELMGPDPTFTDEALFGAVDSFVTSLPSLAVLPFTRNPFAVVAPMSVLTGVEGYIDALDRGTDQQTAKLKGTIDGLVEGVLELASIGKLLRLIDLAPGTAFLKTLAQFFARELPSELATTFLQKLNDQLLLTPEKPMSQFFDELADELVLTAAIVPLAGGAQVGTIKGVQAGAEAVVKGVQKIDEVILGKKVKRTSFETATEYLDSLADQDTFEGKVEVAKRALVEIDESMVEGALAIGERTNLSILNEDGSIQFYAIAQEAGSPGGGAQLSLSETTMLEHNFVSDDKGSMRFAEIKSDAVETDGTSRTRSMIDAGKESIELWEAAIEKIKEGVLIGSNLASNQEALQLAQEELAVLEKDQAEEIAFLKLAKDVLIRVRTRLGLSVPMILSTRPPFDRPARPSTYRAGNHTRWAKESGNGTYIYINYQQVSRAFSPTVKEKFQSSELNTINLLEVMMHETGHSLVSTMYDSIPREVKTALQIQYLSERKLAGDLDLAKAIQRFDQPIRGLTNSEAVAKFIVDSLSPVPGQLELEEAVAKSPFAKYKFSFAEWLANQFVKTTESNIMLRSDVQAFFKDAVTDMKKLHKEMKRENINPTVTYAKFVERVFKLQEITLRKDELIAARERARRAWKDMMKHPPREIMVERVGGIIEGVFGAEGGRIRDRFVKDLDKYNTYVNLVWGLEHISEANAHVPGIGLYRESARAWWSEKSNWTVKTQDVMKRVLDLVDKKNIGANFDAFMFEVDVRSTAESRVLKQEEIAELANEFELNSKEIEAAELMWQQFRDSITAMEEIMVRDTVKDIQDPDERTTELARIKSEMNVLRNRNYMPHSRFGKYTIMVRAKVDGFDWVDNSGKIKTYNQGDIVRFETWESSLAQKRRLKELNKQISPNAATVTENIILSDEVRMFQGLPAPLIRLLRKKLELTDEQKEQLDLVELEMAPSQSFRKHFLRRKGTDGYNTDAMRVFADYFVRFSNHYARVKHNPALEEALGMMETSIKGGVFNEQIIPAATGARFRPGSKRSKIVQWYRDHFTYLNNPGNEYAAIRAWAFHFYLAFLVKSAFVNTTQVPFVTGPYLGSRFGDLASGAMLLEVLRDQALHWKKGKTYPEDEEEMIQILRLSGILEESAATEMAAVQQGSLLNKFAGSPVLGSDKVARTFRSLNNAGTFMFHQAEKWNRAITARAAYRLAKKSGKFSTFNDYVEVAHKAVLDTQFEYARFNRPRIMRGKGAPIFVFMQYLSNMLFFLNNDPARFRYLAILLFIAGISGLPGAENIMDLFDAIVTKGKSWLGMKNPKTQIRTEIREFIQEIADNGMPMLSPDTIMHGAGRNFFGMGPWDISGSLSMGRIIPGTQLLNREGGQGVGNLGRGLAQAGGASVDIALNLWIAAFSNEPDIWKRMERAAPGYAKAISQAARLSIRGEETNLSGYPIMEFTMDSWQDVVMMAGRGLGFPLSALNKEREKRFAPEDVERYYRGKKTILLAKYYYAMNKLEWASLEGDEGILAEIALYNKTVPHEAMRILPMDIQQSLRARKRAELRTIEGQSRTRRSNILYREIWEIYSEGDTHLEKLEFDDANSERSGERPPGG